MKLALPDYHMHTPLCKHADGEMEAYVDHAVAIGLQEIGFSDHMPLMPEPEFCMSFDELPLYVARVRELRKRYEGRIAIRLGCEMDMVLHRRDDIERILGDWEFDYVIGSIHYLDGWPFDQKQYSERFTNEDVLSIFERFFDAVIEADKNALPIVHADASPTETGVPNGCVSFEDNHQSSQPSCRFKSALPST